VLNQTFKCFDQGHADFILQEGFIRIMQLVLLLNAAVESCEAILHRTSELSFTPDCSSSLFGLLHAACLLLTNKYKASNASIVHERNNDTGTTEFSLLIVLADARFNALSTMVQEILSKFSNKLGLNNLSLFSATNYKDIAWMVPAMLYLDIIAQSFIVDRIVVGNAVAEFADCFSRFNEFADSSRYTSSSIFTALRGDTVVIKSLLQSLKALLEIMPKVFYSNKKSIKRHFPSMDATSSPQKMPAYNDDFSSVTPLLPGILKQFLLSYDSPPPLVDVGLSNATKTNCVTMCLVLLERLPPVNEVKEQASLLTMLGQTIMQLLVHVTRYPEAREAFERNNGVAVVLRVRVKYSGFSNVVFSLLQQFLEDETTLVQSMMVAIRLCLHRMIKQQKDDAALETTPETAGSVAFHDFVEMICPLIHRNFSAFRNALLSTVDVFTIVSGSPVFVKLREQSALPAAKVIIHRTTESMISGDRLTELAPMAADDSPELHAVKKRRLLGTGDSAAIATASAAKISQSIVNMDPTISLRPLSENNATSFVCSDEAVHGGLKPQSHHRNGITNSSSKRTRASSQGSTASGEATNAPSAVHTVVDELIGQILLKFRLVLHVRSTATHVSSQEHVDNCCFAAAAEASLCEFSIAELLRLLADLSSSSSAVASWILKYNIRKVSNGMMRSTTAAILPIIHGITLQPMQQSNFIVFLMHSVLLPAASVLAFAKGPGYRTTVAAKNKVVQPPIYNKLIELLGADVVDASCYCLAALASRPTVSRESVLWDLMAVASNYGGMSRATPVVLNTAQQLSSTITFAFAIECLLNPPNSWVLRDAFVVPVKDIMIALMELNIHARIGELLQRVSLDHPLSLETCAALSAILDVFLRKGMPLLQSVAHDTIKAMALKAKMPASANGKLNSATATTGSLHSPVLPADDRNVNNDNEPQHCRQLQNTINIYETVPASSSDGLPVSIELCESRVALRSNDHYGSSVVRKSSEELNGVSESRNFDHGIEQRQQEPTTELEDGLAMQMHHDDDDGGNVAHDTEFSDGERSESSSHSYRDDTLLDMSRLDYGEGDDDNDDDDVRFWCCKISMLKQLAMLIRIIVVCFLFDRSQYYRLTSFVLHNS
jgi:hypothetical protein